MACQQTRPSWCADLPLQPGCREPRLQGALPPARQTARPRTPAQRAGRRSQAAAAGPATAAGRPAPGVYLPPFRLAQLMAQEAAQDKTSAEYQRLTWDALRKSINALVNKVTAQNIKNILHELFREVRGVAHARPLSLPRPC